MVAKLIVHGADRETAIRRGLRALREFEVGPIKTTIPLHRELLVDSSFVHGELDIHLLERLLKARA
jgi:acetyl-CoA carboxylase biotin carboxylase subunit